MLQVKFSHSNWIVILCHLVEGFQNLGVNGLELNWGSRLKVGWGGVSHAYISKEVMTTCRKFCTPLFIHYYHHWQKMILHYSTTRQKEWWHSNRESWVILRCQQIFLIFAYFLKKLFNVRKLSKFSLVWITTQ